MSFGIKLHEYLYGDWDLVKDQLVQELDYLHNSLRLNWDSVFDENNNLRLDSAFGSDTTPTRYIANTGPSGAPQWDLVNLSNGVSGHLAYSHFPSISPSRLIGRGDTAGDTQALTIGSGLQIVGTELSADPATIGGGTPYFIGPTETHTVPLYVQELFEKTIDNEGILDVEGFLIQVGEGGSGSIATQTQAWVPLVDGSEPPNLVSDGFGNLVIVLVDI